MITPPASTAVRSALCSRAAPFLLFMLFIGAGEAVEALARSGSLTLDPVALYYVYPVKTAVVALLLYHYRHHYRELRWRDLSRTSHTVMSVLVALATCTIWVYTDWASAMTGPPQGFNPGLLPPGAVRMLMTAVRVAGAVLVVPLMEELFWRSFLLRYLIDPDFERVALGTFTWLSFLATTILFGLEHHFILAGMIAGAIYSTLLYRTRSLAQCVLSHAITNLALAGYVLHTGKWYFW
jgi:uncharacterized protein